MLLLKTKIKRKRSPMTLIDELQIIGKDSAPHSGKTIYLAAGWFNPIQEKLLKEAYAALLRNQTVAHVHVPLLHQYEGSNPIVNGEFNPDQEWATATFDDDVSAIDNADVVVALLDASDQDTGTIWEMGYAYASHKPVVVLAVGDTFQYPINLMPAQGAIHHLANNNLETFDFYEINKGFYVGKTI